MIAGWSGGWLVASFSIGCAAGAASLWAASLFLAERSNSKQVDKRPLHSMDKEENKANDEDIFTMKKIAVFRSVFCSRNYTPNQPTRCPSSVGRLDFCEKRSGSLDNLSEFSHMWVLFKFHDNDEKSNERGKILPPRKPDLKKVGVFSCRSPNRPNAIGLSLVKIDKVDTKTFQIHVSGVDILDGTPVFDIKPYIPHHDSPPLLLAKSEVRVPDWIASSSMLQPDFCDVQVEDRVLDKLARMDLSRALLKTPEEYAQLLKEVLSWDGRKRHIRMEHERSIGGGVWMFELAPKLDFLLVYPEPGRVQCVDVYPKGVIGYIPGKGLVHLASGESALTR